MKSLRDFLVVFAVKKTAETAKYAKNTGKERRGNTSLLQAISQLN